MVNCPGPGSIVFAPDRSGQVLFPKSLYAELVSGTLVTSTVNLV